MGEGIQAAFRAAGREELRRARARVAAEILRLGPPLMAGRTQPCPRCTAPIPVVAEYDITRLGDPELRIVVNLGPCPTEGCGTTCVSCHRKPGEVHGPHCWDRMRLKTENPHIVDRSDCLA